MKKYGLNQKEMAAACAMATAFIIQECQNDLEVESGFNTAAYGLIEGSKTVIPEMTELPLKESGINSNYFNFKTK